MNSRNVLKADQYSQHATNISITSQ